MRILLTIVLLVLASLPLRASSYDEQRISAQEAERQLIDILAREASDSAVLDAAERLRNMAAQEGSQLLYYKSYAYAIWYFSANFRLQTAQDWVNVLVDAAQRHGNVYGNCFANWALGDIYRVRHNYPIAQEHYLAAIEYAKQTKDISVAQIYLSQLLTMSSRDVRTYDFLAEAYKYSRNREDSLAIAMRTAITYGRMGDKVNYDLWTKELERLKAEADSSSMGHIVIAAYEPFEVYNRFRSELTHRIYGYCLNGQTDMAMKAIDSLGNDYNKTFVRIGVYRLLHDTLNEYRYRIRMDRYNDSLSGMQARVGLEEMAMRYQRDRLLEEKRTQESRLVILGSVALLVIALLVIAFLVTYARGRNRAMKNLQGLTHSLEQANQIQKNFLHNMSHEVRTPLNAICGFATLLADDSTASFLTDQDRADMRRQIQSNTDLLLTLVNDILDIADIQSGKYRLNITSCDIVEVCHTALLDVKQRVPVGVELKFDNQLGDTFFFTSDANRVKQILLNFLTNACKHTAEGSITLTACKKGGNLELSVADTGEGIAPENAEIIFSRFEKLDTFKQGTGLGLAICRSISQLLHGSVYLDTEYTGGARFVFLHPL